MASRSLISKLNSIKSTPTRIVALGRCGSNSRLAGAILRSSSAHNCPSTPSKHFYLTSLIDQRAYLHLSRPFLSIEPFYYECFLIDLNRNNNEKRKYWKIFFFEKKIFFNHNKTKNSQFSKTFQIYIFTSSYLLCL